MRTEKKNHDQILEQAITEIRAGQLSDADVKQAAARVWARVGQAASTVQSQAIDVGKADGPVHLHGCADFQALIPVYLTKKLPEAHLWLFEDHMHSCPACRSALEHARSGKIVEFEPKTRRNLFAAPEWKWAIAAAVVVGVGIGGWQARDTLLPAPGGPRAMVQSVTGELYRVSDTGSTMLSAGAEIGERDRIRAGRSSDAMLRLADGSLLEMRERSELSLSRQRSGTTIQLARGSVIVQAAKQRTGRLFVATNDCLVSVKGTTFAVDRGTKGSRVAVIEGEVRVDGQRETKMLHPGEQISTDASMQTVPIKDEIAWSRNINQHLALLGEFSVLQKRLEQVPGPGVRYSSRLLDLVPAGTVLYVSIPNIGGMLGEAQRVLDERLAQSAVLRDWWNSNGSPEKLKQVLDTIRGLSDYLGNEVVLTVSHDGSGHFGTPLVMAQVTRSDFRSYLEQQVAQISGQGHSGLTIVQDAAALPVSGTHQGAFALLTGDMVAISPDPQGLRALAASLNQPGSGAFTQTAFYRRVADEYRAGAGWLICADMEQILPNSVNEERHGGRQAAEIHKNMMSQLGISDMQHLVVERKEVGGKTENRAMVTFSQQRRGMASWLAAPAPMGALDFVSPGATLVLAFVVKQPRAALEELFSAIRAVDANFSTNQAKLESELGVSVLDDLAAPLGSEVAFAIDGPVLPPSWKFAIEVYDSARLQKTIETIVSRANQVASENPNVPPPGLQLSQQQVGARTYYVVRSSRSTLEVHYSSVDGYLVAASSSALLTRAIDQRGAGDTLTRSERFKTLLAPDGYSNFSAILYQNIGSVLGPLMDTVRSSGNLTPDQQRSVDALRANSGPSLIYAYGQSDRVEIASTGSFFGLNLDMLAGAGGPFQIPNLLGKIGRTRQ
ncbi:MAG: hypothetical protein DMG57_08870 [Acidobacteria bacterium]|nr:MAG: hypothetical protein DMG57_08870 [Acidobacteriota bacterium]